MMRRLQILSSLLLLCLIVVAFQLYCASSSGFQETKAGSFKMKSSEYDLNNTGGSKQKLMRNRKEAYEKKVHKRPSGPSPIGNNRPPSKA